MVLLVAACCFFLLLLLLPVADADAPKFTLLQT